MCVICVVKVISDRFSKADQNLPFSYQRAVHSHQNESISLGLEIACRFSELEAD